MSTYLGKTLLSGVSTNVISNAHSLLDFKWTDHILNEMSWLRADTFSWHSGDVYIGAYNHLVADYESAAHNIEIINGISIIYYKAEDGHKIVLSNMETTVQNIYNSTGVAWYYILDTVNKRFKLPRTKFGFVGLRDEVGKYVPAGLPNITGTINQVYLNSAGSDSGALKRVIENTNATWTSGSGWGGNRINLDASNSNSIYGNSDTVQQKAIQMYLYFYVGNYDTADLENIEIYNNKANIDMDNLTEDGKNIATWSSNVTNCITHIPQDIKLELNNGTLTLKAGSKVYVPNGFEEDGTTPKFDEVDILSDTTQTQTPWTTNQLFIVYNTDTGKTEMIDTIVTSGSTAPASPSNGYWWYDTGNNQIKTYYNNTWDVKNVSLPIAIVSSDGSTLTSLDMLFNGFGYIGNTKFVLPGVKGLNPNGRNEDGTLNNTLITTETVLTITGASTDTVIGYFNSNSLNNHSATTFIYDEELNLIVRASDKKPYKEIYSEGKIPYTNTYHQTNGKIDFCTFHKVFHSLNYNNKSIISGWGMPSDRYIDLTLGSSGTYYTAPVNGYVQFSKWTGNTSQFISINTDSISIQVTQTASSIPRCFIPVRKGQRFQSEYTASGETTIFRFYYAEGEVE